MHLGELIPISVDVIKQRFLAQTSPEIHCLRNVPVCLNIDTSFYTNFFLQESQRHLSQLSSLSGLGNLVQDIAEEGNSQAQDPTSLSDANSGMFIQLPINNRATSKVYYWRGGKRVGDLLMSVHQARTCLENFVEDCSSLFFL